MSKHDHVLTPSDLEAWRQRSLAELSPRIPATCVLEIKIAESNKTGTLQILLTARVRRLALTLMFFTGFCLGLLVTQL